MRLTPLVLVGIAFGAAAMAAAAGNPTEDSPGQLPSLEREVQRPYLYAEVSGVRILSLADRRTTRDFADTVADNVAIFHQLLPERGRTSADNAFAVLLAPPGFDALTPARMVRMSGTRMPGRTMVLHGVGDVPIVLAEAMAKDARDPLRPVYENIDPEKELLRQGRHQLRPAEWWALHFCVDYSNHVLERHRRLPMWYRVGLRKAAIRSGSVHGVVVEGSSVLIPRGPGAAKPASVQLMPLAEFLAITDQAGRSRTLARMPAALRVAHEVQSNIFLYWGLTDGDADHRERFRQFVAAACDRPIDERLFESCFGYGFAEAEKRLAKFAERLLVRDGRLENGKLDFLLEQSAGGKKREVEVRAATREEVIGLIGEAILWRSVDEEALFAVVGPVALNRGRWGYWPSPWLKTSAPFGAETLVPAHKVIAEAAAASRDPRLIALLGSYELRMGNVAEGERWLREAVAAKVRRPRVYVDLAWLTLERALTAPAGTKGRLSREQIQPALELLREGARQMPEMVAAYLMQLYAWGISDAVTSPEELAALATAVRLYPDTESMAAIALLCERAGRHAEAVEFANAALASTPYHRVLRQQLVPVLGAADGQK
ncbi:hypothetical protein [Opitutus sp. ER46]|uniref:hypothetical protein n=1 Tax=Opitutus sp. ER46 TaxID=2161864 RepID=UPI000D31E25E|nr:hypothetical protein [Opitutus sp. ER46]